MRGFVSVPFGVFHSDSCLTAMQRLGNQMICEVADYDYAESGDVCFNDARCDLLRILAACEVMMRVCKIDSVEARTIL